VAEHTGAALYLKFGSTVLSTDYRTFDSDEAQNLVDASAGADTYKTFLATLTEASAKANLVSQTGGTVLWAAVAPGTSGTLEWGEEGTASTKPKHTALAVVEKRAKSVPYDGLVVIAVDWKFQGTVTDSAY